MSRLASYPAHHDLESTNTVVIDVSQGSGQTGPCAACKLAQLYRDGHLPTWQLAICELRTRCCPLHLCCSLDIPSC